MFERAPPLATLMADARCGNSPKRVRHRRWADFISDPDEVALVTGV
jgi:hypothetical protein